MAHYAKLDENNIVLKVEYIDNSDCLDGDGNESEEVGRQFLENLHGWVSWKKCSYNSLFGKYYVEDEYGVRQLGPDQTKVFRKSYPGIGWKYDATRDAFIPPKELDSWTLNETTCEYEAPVSKPDQLVLEHAVIWDDVNSRWTSLDGDDVEHYWDPDTSTWVAV